MESLSSTNRAANSREIFRPEVNAIVTNNFSSSYFLLHNYVYSLGQFQPSRNGGTREVIQFKTHLTNPYRRCVGGLNRDMNIFFLIAEAIWIFAGRRDVQFLDTFNSNLKNYSDDGQYYHAPYGWRLRNYGTPSTYSGADERDGIDQIVQVISELHRSPDSRRAVASIWNPEFDLCVDSKDLPCNDVVMFKARDGGLTTTIANRSNDLNLGLTTNVFQFSFVSELIANCLGLHCRQQVHNSDSLHIYVQERLTTDIQSQIEFLAKLQAFTVKDGFADERNRSRADLAGTFTLYDGYTELRMSYGEEFSDTSDPIRRLRAIDFHLKAIIARLITLQQAERVNTQGEIVEYGETLYKFSPTLFYYYRLLLVYVNYKKHKSQTDAIYELKEVDSIYGLSRYDFFALALNFFFKRLLKAKGNEVAEQLRYQLYPNHSYLGKL